ncbi:MAG TPA: DnaJ domain-containing protein [Clostridia bacterium]|nr:DnaJ domain-containing protein [Clostridia bacterium]
MKKNPYEVLGVSDNSSDEEIRQAYRHLARKYSSDNFSGGPLSDVSHKKMKEIDEAYDYIILNRGKRSGGGGTRITRETKTNEYRYSTGTSEYADIREKIKTGRFDDAHTLLDGIPKQARSAEWYYLKGTVQYRQGWLEEAYNNFSTAHRMEPGNEEYKAAFSNINNSRSGGYRTSTAQKNSGCSGCSGCDICTGLICADCCCECMGGDLITCC